MLFTKEQLQHFLAAASNSKFRLEKLALVIGIAGRLRACEYHCLNWDDISFEVEEDKRVVKMKVYRSKTHVWHTFTVCGEAAAIVGEWYDICKNVRDLPGRVFWWQWRHGRLHQQRVGKSWFYRFTISIAKFLELPNADKYTSHVISHTGMFLSSHALYSHYFPRERIILFSCVVMFVFSDHFRC